ncbi:DUF6298 domain-containing protein [Pedobacter glucosidilyticus]|uniref:DUF6298 domain-containing protein n=1 Tax=Pedobacter glucosidilyticus TaxID=1122941 RepID=UPI00040BEEA8|nr:DUF6298 domain-containing protein [Pedobacter glucosidilyticus]
MTIILLKKVLKHGVYSFSLNFFSLGVYLFLGLSPLVVKAQKKEAPKSPVYLQKEGKLAYTPDALGNRIPDYSYSGYQAGENAIPNVPVKVVVPTILGDATATIQAAIDEVAKLPLDKNGFRGAVLLQKAVYQVYGTIKINASGVVLRGSGFLVNGTTILGKGTNREILIRVLGKQNQVKQTPVSIVDDYVPVNAFQFKIADVSSFKVGDQILIHRPSTQEWITKLNTVTFGGGLSSLGWKPGQRDIFWDRKIIAINGNNITIDVPITTALDKQFGQATVAKYQWNGRITNIGVENLQLVSDYNQQNKKDEDHRWNAINIENAADVWVRQINFKHFAGSAVYVNQNSKRVTVEDCKSLAPVSEIGGERRNTFYTKGQQTLFQRLYAEFGYHDFAVGFMAAGPNAFVQCQAVNSHSFSGAIDSWASGALFDVMNIDGQALSFANRGQDGQGAGWTAANSLFWQCSAAKVYNEQPPTAQNWAFGTWAQFAGDGFWDMSNEHVNPRSFYYAQLEDRLGKSATARKFLLPVASEASSSPSIETALALTQLAAKPILQLSQFIDDAGSRTPINTDANGAKILKPIIAKENLKAGDMKLKNGFIIYKDKVVTGAKQDIQWWSGSARPFALDKMRPHITRFVPGEIGNGLTDDLEELTTSMQQKNVVAMDHNYGLWYERRRDDHQRVRRMDAEVWPPFYEQPFARSGQGIAWDGLSKYDLTTFNKWYWGRLQQFANLADEKGLVLLHQNYFQHNILEAGAHYADFPWRPANNINDTGFPEPVPYAGDKRIFMAEQFYDVNHPVRRALHRNYIRQCLENFKDNSSVIQLTSAEYTGPTHFVAFWLDVIKEWELETGKKPIIGLSATKDVQDEILADPERSKYVNVIDIRYWFYQENGMAYAPKGGQNLAPRQHARLTKVGKSSFEQVYRAVAEYRSKYPDKAVIYNAGNYDRMGWAVFMAGGSLADLPLITDENFLKDAATMKPQPQSQKGFYTLANESSAIVYQNNQAEVKLGNGTYVLSYISPQSGKVLKQSTIKINNQAIKTEDLKSDVVVWIKKK